MMEKGRQVEGEQEESTERAQRHWDQKLLSRCV